MSDLRCRQREAASERPDAAQQLLPLPLQRRPRLELSSASQMRVETAKRVTLTIRLFPLVSLPIFRPAVRVLSS